MKVIGTAGWSIPKELRAKFPGDGPVLTRYSGIFNGVEINSSFYREHLPRTYERWATEVPGHFRFSVKLSQEFTHNCELKPRDKDLRQSLEGILHLGEKLGVILLQFPGSTEFQLRKMDRFLRLLRKHYEGPLAVEARNCSWASSEASSLMLDHRVSKVIADPERCPGGTKKLFTASGTAYYRLHGAPVIYRSSYSPEFLRKLTEDLRRYKNAWIIFDNTTFGEATTNALSLIKRCSLRSLT